MELGLVARHLGGLHCFILGVYLSVRPVGVFQLTKLVISGGEIVADVVLTFPTAHNIAQIDFVQRLDNILGEILGSPSCTAPVKIHCIVVDVNNNIARYAYCAFVPLFARWTVRSLFALLALNAGKSFHASVALLARWPFRTLFSNVTVESVFALGTIWARFTS